MQVKEVMSTQPTYISKHTSLQEAASKMADIDCGFMPVGDDDRIDGVITDRDIALRAVAQGKDIKEIQAGDVLTDKVLYCFEDDSVEDAANSMRNQKVYRLIVLNNPQEKRLRGIVTLGDIARAGHHEELVGKTAEHICKAA